MGDGSALRVRGNLNQVEPSQVVGRFRSACAGQPPRCTTSFASKGVPLCVCGATYWTPSPPSPHGGSALRVRGNRVPPGSPLRSRRFRSACAGQPQAHGLKRLFREVPLCVCGATFPSRQARPPVPGSALRVRGNPGRAGAGAGGIRFRSACAGQPLSRYSASTAFSVPLCVCGATGSPGRIVGRLDGSALRVRGNPAGPGPAMSTGRFRSACAGQPMCNEALYVASRVPLCVCGATGVGSDVSQFLQGSALRVRGNRPPAPRLPGR